MTDVWANTLLDLIRRTSCDLPQDIEETLRSRMAAEKTGSRARAVLTTLVENASLARRRNAPLCQDTGTLSFFWRLPYGARTDELERQMRIAVAESTRRGWLRRNTVDTLTGQSIDANVAEGAPVFHFEQENRDDVVVWLLQKGGGSENMTVQ